MKTHDCFSKLDACEEAQDWAYQYYTIEEAWSVCPRGDWMLWLWGRHCGGPMDDRRRPLVLAAVECARLALPAFEQNHPNDHRPREALNIAEKWGRGEAVTRRDIVDAARAARAARIAHDDSTAQAPYAAAYVAVCADSEAAAGFAADAAHTDAAHAADRTAAQYALLAQCANIVRRHLPTPVFIAEPPATPNT